MASIGKHHEAKRTRVLLLLQNEDSPGRFLARLVNHRVMMPSLEVPGPMPADGGLDAAQRLTATLLGQELACVALCTEALAHGGREVGVGAVFTANVSFALPGFDWMDGAELLRSWSQGALLLAPEVLTGLRAALGSTAQESLPAWTSGLRTLPLRSPTLPPATHTNCYLLGHSRLLVVDPGCVDLDEQQRLLAAIDGLHPERAAVVLTHRHRDHIAFARGLAERGLEVYAHGECARLIANEVNVTATLEDGEVLDGFEVIHTPGHARGHICLRQQQTGALLCGDLMASVGTVVINPPDGDMGDYLESLRRIRSLSAPVIFPAHGPPIEDVVSHIDATIAHRLSRELQILAAVAREGLSSFDVVERVYTDVPRHLWPLAEGSVRAHLAKLIDEGRVSFDGRRYRAIEVG